MRSWLPWMTLAALVPGVAGPALGQQTPITGPPGRTFSSLRASDYLFRVSFVGGRFKLVGPRGQTREAKTQTLLLPPAPGLPDEGAIDAAIEIVVARNPTLSASLTRSGRGQPPAWSDARYIPGELYLRIHKPASVNGRRRDVPANAFAASPMRSVSYPQFEPRGER